MALAQWDSILKRGVSRMPIKGGHHTEEAKELIREARRGTHHTKESIEKMSKGHLGQVAWNKGKEHLPMEKNGRWNGGLKHYDNGYVGFKVPEGCKFSCMKDSQGYVPIHRLTMAAHLGRPLKLKEVVHHINGIRSDNRKENLRLLEGHSEHIKIHNKLRGKQYGEI